MNFFDIIVVSIISLSTLVGFFRGFVYLSIGFIAFICSLYFAYVLSPFIQPFVTEYIKNDLASRIISGISSYFITTIFFALVSSQVKSIMKDLRGGVIDRLFGLMLGSFKGLTISLAIFLSIAIFSTNAYVGVQNIQEMSEKMDRKEYPQFLTKSLSYPVILSILDIAGNFISKDMLEKITIPTRANVMDNINLTPAVDIKIDLNNTRHEDKKIDNSSPKTLESELEEFVKENSEH